MFRGREATLGQADDPQFHLPQPDALPYAAPGRADAASPLGGRVGSLDESASNGPEWVREELKKRKMREMVQFACHFLRSDDDLRQYVSHIVVQGVAATVGLTHPELRRLWRRQQREALRYPGV